MPTNKQGCEYNDKRTHGRVVGNGSENDAEYGVEDANDADQNSGIFLQTPVCRHLEDFKKMGTILADYLGGYSKGKVLTIGMK